MYCYILFDILLIIYCISSPKFDDNYPYLILSFILLLLITILTILWGNFIRRPGIRLINVTHTYLASEQNVNDV